MKQPNLPHQSRSLNIELTETLKIRRKIVQSIAKTFKPDAVLIAQDPLEFPDEMRRILGYIREKFAGTKVIWSLPDLVGESQSIIRQWQKNKIYDLFQKHCDEIWVYGIKDVFDHIHEYRIPPVIADKMHHMGYLQTNGVSGNGVPKNGSAPNVLITVGSGIDGHKVIDNYLNFLETRNSSVPFKSFIFTSPMMPSQQKSSLMERAQKLPNVVIHRFSKKFLQYLESAHLVVCTGGYNTLCEILSSEKNAVLVPCRDRFNEHILRSNIFQKLDKFKLLSPEELSPEKLREMVLAPFSNGHLKKAKVNGEFGKKNGFDNILIRLNGLLAETAPVFNN